MRFGYSQNIHDLTKKRDYGELLDELRDLAVICDRAGMDTFWLPEHHFSVWGRELIPNPILLAADLAARTERIRIGLAAVIVTFWHPLRVAEDIAMLDHLTGGRLELGVGRGNYGLEAQNLNPIADPNNQPMNIKVFEEAVAIIKKALGEERFSFKGEIYEFPAPGFKADRAHSVNDPEYIDPNTKELVKISIYPRAKQKPLPPMWQVVNSIESIQHAARLDMGIIMWRPGAKSLKHRLTAYRDAVKQAYGHELRMGERTGILRDTFCARTEEEAVSIAAGPMMGSLNFSNWRGPSIYLDPGEKLGPEEEARLKKHLPYEFVRDRCVMFGAPERIIGQVDELHRETGIEHVIFKCSWPGIDPARTRESVRLLCQEVLPVLKAKFPQPRAVTAAAE
jgi:alkanesulfonate monooxygenase SsuD/methylene tetrahydromethanopterin reductase-like flavin-dependent oxidoreductase (luciferase family)